MFIWIVLMYRLLYLFPDTHVIIQFLDEDAHLQPLFLSAG